MKKIIMYMYIVVSMLTFTGCNDLEDVSFTETNQRPIAQTASESIYTINLDGEEVVLGTTKPSDLNGWILSDDANIGKDSQKVPVPFKVTANGEAIEMVDVRISLVSDKDEDIPAKDAIIYSFYADCMTGIEKGLTLEQMALPELCIADKITWGSTYKDVIEVMGEPSSKSNVLDEHTLSYYYPEGQLVIKINSDGNYSGYGVYSVNVVKTVG